MKPLRQAVIMTTDRQMILEVLLFVVNHKAAHDALRTHADVLAGRSFDPVVVDITIDAVDMSESLKR